MPYGARSRSRSRGLLNAWAGESRWRRLVAWVAQSAILLGVLAIGVALIWFVLTPMMIDGLTRILTQ